MLYKVYFFNLKCCTWLIGAKVNLTLFLSGGFPTRYELLGGGGRVGCGGRSCPILSRERIIISRRARRQSKDINKMHLKHTLKILFRVSGQVKVRSNVKIADSYSPAAADTLSDEGTM